MASRDSSADRGALATELAGRCAPLLTLKDWNDISSAVGQMHDHLAEDIPDESEFNDVFGGFLAQLIDRLGSPDIGSSPQAYVYGQSGNATHRERAAAWMVLHRAS
jgi:hypothetical protein